MPVAGDDLSTLKGSVRTFFGLQPPSNHEKVARRDRNGE